MTSTYDPNRQNSSTLRALKTEAPVVVLPSVENVVIDEAEVGAKISALFIRGLDVAMDLLNSNIASLQLPIARTVLVAATKLLGQDNNQQTRDLRVQLDAIWSELRELPDAVKADAVTPTVDDPDEEPRTSET